MNSPGNDRLEEHLLFSGGQIKALFERLRHRYTYISIIRHRRESSPRLKLAPQRSDTHECNISARRTCRRSHSRRRSTCPERRNVCWCRIGTRTVGRATRRCCRRAPTSGWTSTSSTTTRTRVTSRRSRPRIRPGIRSNPTTRCRESDN